MLSRAAEAALLKTLEEPPPHVVFVLATTDPQKVSPTIRSRTQHLRVPPAAGGRARGARALGGRGRRARRSATTPSRPCSTWAAARPATRSPRSTRWSRPAAWRRSSCRSTSWSRALIEADPGRALAALAAAVQGGRDPRALAEELIAHLRDGFLALVAPELVQLPDRRQRGRAGPGAAPRPAGHRPGHGGARRDAGRAAPRARSTGPARRGAGQADQRRRRRVAGRAAGPDREAGAGPAGRPRRPARRCRAAPATRRPEPGPPGPAPAPRPGSPAPGGRAAARQRRRCADGRPAAQPAPAPPGAGPAGASRHRRGDAPAAEAAAPAGAAAAVASTARRTEPGRADAGLGRPGPAPRCRARPSRSWPPGTGSATDGGVALAVPNEPHRARSEQHRAELEAALAAHFGRPVPVTFVLDADAPRPAASDAGGRDRSDPAPTGPRAGGGGRPGRAGRRRARARRWPRSSGSPRPSPAPSSGRGLSRGLDVRPAGAGADRRARPAARHRPEVGAAHRLPPPQAARRGRRPPGHGHHRGQGQGALLRALLERVRGTRCAGSASTTSATPALLCVVEEARDIVAIEKTGEFRGRYHVLLGAISPIDGIGPEQLKMQELLLRLEPEGVRGGHPLHQPERRGRGHRAVPGPAAEAARRAGHPPGQRPAGRRRPRVRRRADARPGPGGSPRAQRPEPDRARTGPAQRADAAMAPARDALGYRPSRW